MRTKRQDDRLIEMCDDMIGRIVEEESTYGANVLDRMSLLSARVALQRVRKYALDRRQPETAKH